MNAVILNYFLRILICCIIIEYFAGVYVYGSGSEEDEEYSKMVYQARCFSNCFDTYGSPVPEKHISEKKYELYVGNECLYDNCTECLKLCEDVEDVTPNCTVGSCTSANCSIVCDRSLQNDHKSDELEEYVNSFSISNPKLICKYIKDNATTLFLKWSVDRNDVIEEAENPQLTFVVQYKIRSSKNNMADAWITIGMTNHSFVPIHGLMFKTEYKFRITVVYRMGILKSPVESKWITTLKVCIYRFQVTDSSGLMSLVVNYYSLKYEIQNVYPVQISKNEDEKDTLEGSWLPPSQENNFKPKAPKRMNIVQQTFHKDAISAMLSWEPSEGPPCFYKLYWMSSCSLDYAAEEIQSPPVNQYWINNLRFGCNYTVTMNSFDNGSFINGSKSLALKFSTKVCVNATGYNYNICPPVSPRNIHWSLLPEYMKNNVTYEDVYVSWEPPIHSSNENRILGYFLSWRKEIPLHLSQIIPPHRDQSTMKGSITNTTLKRLHKGYIYSLKIHAISKAGRGVAAHIEIDVGDHQEPRMNETVSALKMVNKRDHLYVVIVVLLVAMIITSALLVCLWKQNRIKQCLNKRDQHTVGMEEMNPIYSSADVTEPLVTDEYEIDFSNIKFISVIGEGAFGKVMKAELFHTNNNGRREARIVAIKILKENHDTTEKRNLMLEIEAMKHLGHHPNIVSIVGCCTKGPKICLVMDYCLLGDLRNYLLQFRHKQVYGIRRNQRSSDSGISRNSKLCSSDNTLDENSEAANSLSGANNSPKYRHLYSSQESLNGASQENVDSIEEIDPFICQATLLSYARQIAIGMEYLSQKKFIHRDLAARNILMCDDKRLKISDFGLTRDVYETNMYQPTSSRKLPYKWMAIEAIFDQTFTIKSDVWSFGIVLWEIVTLAGSPYPGIPNKDIFRLLKDGYRMEKPENCSPEIYQIMLSCWHPNPSCRPSFTDLRRKLEKMLEVTKSYINLSVSVSEDYYRNDSSSGSSVPQCSSSGGMKISNNKEDPKPDITDMLEYADGNLNSAQQQNLNLSIDPPDCGKLHINIPSNCELRTSCDQYKGLESPVSFSTKPDRSEWKTRTPTNIKSVFEIDKKPKVTKTISLQTVGNRSCLCFHSSSPLGHRTNDICRFCDFQTFQSNGYTNPIKQRADNSTL